MDFFTTAPSSHPKGWPWICQRRNAHQWHVIKPSWAKREGNPHADNSDYVSHAEVTDFCEARYPYCGEWHFTDWYYDDTKNLNDPRPSEEFFRGNYSRG